MSKFYKLSHINSEGEEFTAFVDVNSISIVSESSNDTYRTGNAASIVYLKDNPNTICSSKKPQEIIDDINKIIGD